MKNFIKSSVMALSLFGATVAQAESIKKFLMAARFLADDTRIMSF